MGKIKDYYHDQIMHDTVPKVATHAHKVETLTPYHYQFIGTATVCYLCTVGELATCAKCDDTLAGYFPGTVYCDSCADSV